MAYGNVVGYEPAAQPGAYHFEKNDGSKFLAFGEPAEALRARVDASQRALAAVQNNPDITPQAVAQGGGQMTPGAPVIGPNDQYVNQSSAPPVATDATQASPAANMSAAPAPTPAQEQAKQQIQALFAAPSANAPAAAPAEPEKQQGVLVVRDPKTGQTIYSEPGKNPGDPRHTYALSAPTGATKAGFAPSSMKISGGSNAVSPADVEALRENSIDQKLAYQTSYDLHAESFAEQRAALDAQEASNAIAAREAMERTQQMQAKTDAMATQYEQAKKDYSEASIDPDRYMKQSAGGGWLKALGMALGAAGAALAKTPNFAQQFVEQQIAYDIRAQEAQIKIKGDRQQTLLGDLQRQLGSLDLAKSAYSGVMLQESKRQLEVLANHAGSRDAAANYLQGAAQLDAALQANDVNFRKQAAGTVETEYRYHMGSAGSPGGEQPLTIEQARELKGIFPGAKEASKKQEAAETQARALALNKQAATEAGLVLNPSTGRWEEGPNAPGAGTWILNHLGFETDQNKAINSALRDYVPVKAHQLGERPPPVAQVDSASEKYREGRLTASLIAGLNQDRDAILTGKTVAPATTTDDEEEK